MTPDAGQPDGGQPDDGQPDDGQPDDGQPDDEHPGDGRIVLLVTSPRVAPGLLAWPAWQRLRQADAVLGADVDDAWHRALQQAGVRVRDVGGAGVGERAGRLLEAATPGATVVWLGGADGDPGLTDALAEHLSRRAVAGRPPEVELVTGSYDVPGARLLDLVAVTDRLRSPGGCPWDAGQTHASLAPYLLEEAHEVLEALDALAAAEGDPATRRRARAHLVEELGDLLLQVVFHARVAAEDGDDPFDVDDVAAGIVAKLVRRHPHVFAAAGGGGAGGTGSGGDGAPSPLTAGDVEATWEDLKDAEKQRSGPFDGIPATLPALARAQKMLARLERAGRTDVVRHVLDVRTGEGTTDVGRTRSGTADAVRTADGTGDGTGDGTADAVRTGADLLALVARARADGVDAEASLRAVLAAVTRAVEPVPGSVEPVDTPAAAANG